MESHQSNEKVLRQSNCAGPGQCNVYLPNFYSQHINTGYYMRSPNFQFPPVINSHLKSVKTLSINGHLSINCSSVETPSIPSEPSLNLDIGQFQSSKITSCPNQENNKPCGINGKLYIFPCNVNEAGKDKPMLKLKNLTEESVPTVYYNWDKTYDRGKKQKGKTQGEKILKREEIQAGSSHWRVYLKHLKEKYENIQFLKIEYYNIYKSKTEYFDSDNLEKLKSPRNIEINDLDEVDILLRTNYRNCKYVIIFTFLDEKKNELLSLPFKLMNRRNRYERAERKSTKEENKLLIKSNDSCKPSVKSSHFEISIVNEDDFQELKQKLKPEGITIKNKNWGEIIKAIEKKNKINLLILCFNKITKKDIKQYLNQNYINETRTTKDMSMYYVRSDGENNYLIYGNLNNKEESKEKEKSKCTEDQTNGKKRTYPEEKNGREEPNGKRQKLAEGVSIENRKSDYEFLLLVRN